MGRWRLVIVPAYVPDSAPGAPSHPIVLPPESTTPPWSPHPEHPIPPTVWPQPPGGGGGQPPGFWGGTPPEYIDIGLPGPQPPSGGAPPYPSHPIPPTVWPNPPSGGGGGEPPGFWGGRPPEWVDTTPPGPQPSPGWPPVAMPPIYNPPPGGGGEPPGIWGGQPPNYVDIGGPGPQPPPGSVMPPIYLPPTIWPDPPEGLPSFDPDQLPQHPDLPDLNHGVWYWVDNDGAMERAFIAQVVRPSHDLPGYEPNEPPEETQPGDWVVALLNAQRPAWAWIPSATPTPPETEDDPHVEHHGAKAAKADKA